LHFLQILYFFFSIVLYPIRAGFPQLGQINFALETEIEPGINKIWPFSPDFLGFWCFFLKFIPSIKIRFSSGKA